MGSSHFALSLISFEARNDVNITQSETINDEKEMGEASRTAYDRRLC